jgi:hypothetical protein
MVVTTTQGVGRGAVCLARIGEGYEIEPTIEEGRRGWSFPRLGRGWQFWAEKAQDAVGATIFGFVIQTASTHATHRNAK